MFLRMPRVPHPQAVWSALRSPSRFDPMRALVTHLADGRRSLREHVDFVGSSSRWCVEKPAMAFFERVATEAGLPFADIAYVGDRVDNDVEPALAAGMVAVHIRRGPWGHLHEPPPAAVRIDSLDELPQVLGV